MHNPPAESLHDAARAPKGEVQQAVIRAGVCWAPNLEGTMLSSLLPNAVYLLMLFSALRVPTLSSSE